MAKYDYAPFAKVNATAYRDHLRKHPDDEYITLTRGQMEAICRDLADYTDRDADARGWAEQATTNAERIAALTAERDKALDDWARSEAELATAEARVAQLERALRQIRDECGGIGIGVMGLITRIVDETLSGLDADTHGAGEGE